MDVHQDTSVAGAGGDADDSVGKSRIGCDALCKRLRLLGGRMRLRIEGHTGDYTDDYSDDSLHNCSF